MQEKPSSFINQGQCLSSKDKAPSESAKRSPGDLPSPSVKRTVVTRRTTNGRATATVAPTIIDWISVERLPVLMDAWLMACDAKECSPSTIASRRERLSRLQWYIEQNGYTRVDIDVLRSFFHYVRHAHENGGARWGNTDHKKTVKPVTPARLKAFYSSFRTFFNWLIKQGDLSISPLEKVDAPIDRPDQIVPFSDEQIQALLAAAASTYSPRRDRAIILLLLDTGIRAAELCGLTIDDVDLDSCRITVTAGKGHKARTVPFDRDTRRAMYDYLSERGFENGDESYFLSERGKVAGEALTVNGLSQMIERIGKVAQITGVRCSSHTFRHTHALSFLRAGGNMFTLQQILGHTSLAMTQRYVNIAQADITAQHKQYSPVARLRTLGGKPSSRKVIARKNRSLSRKGGR